MSGRLTPLALAVILATACGPAPTEEGTESTGQTPPVTWPVPIACGSTCDSVGGTCIRFDVYLDVGISETTSAMELCTTFCESDAECSALFEGGICAPDESYDAARSCAKACTLGGDECLDGQFCIADSKAASPVCMWPWAQFRD